ncbi:hypothetical protein BASA83_000226 [Batrachochytrium salamandrivorans]|nr:hypothetical protein BASA83_000226 [Batrachochytrium salamandrivorans]
MSLSGKKLGELMAGVFNVYVTAPAIAVSVALIMVRSLTKSRMSNHVPGPFSWPLVGALPMFLPYILRDQMHEIIDIMCAKYGKIWRVSGINQESFLISDADTIRHILVNPSDYRRGPQFQMASVGIANDALIILPTGPTWASHRKLMQPSFSSSNLIYAAHVSDKCVGTMISSINADIKASDTGVVVVDIYCYSMALALDIIGLVTLKHDFKALHACAAGETCESQVLLEDSLNIVQRRLHTPKYMWRVLGIHTDSHRVKEIAAFNSRLVKKVIEEHEAEENGAIGLEIPGSRDSDVIHFLLKDRLKEKPTYSDEGLADEIIGMVTAGHEASANTFTLAIYALCMNPRVLEKLVAEIDQMYDQHNGNLPLENIKDIQYLEWVIKETQRRHTVVRLISREVVKNAQVMGFQFQAGARFILSLSGVHQDARYWDNPLEFIPERWAQPIVPGTFVPFGEGEMKCVGRHIAMTETRIVITRLLREFTFSVVPGQDLKFITTITHSLKKGFRVHLAKRSHVKWGFITTHVVPGLSRDTNPIRELMYADDVAVFADSEQSLLSASTAVEQWANRLQFIQKNTTTTTTTTATTTSEKPTTNGSDDYAPSVPYVIQS